MFHTYASADAGVSRLDERTDLANVNDHCAVNGNAKDRTAALGEGRHGCVDDFRRRRDRTSGGHIGPVPWNLRGHGDAHTQLPCCFCCHSDSIQDPRGPDHGTGDRASTRKRQECALDAHLQP